MAKPYEIYGIPENSWLEYDQPPECAIIYDDNDEDDPFDSPYGIYPGQVRLWGKVDYWTPLEAALLLAGVSPDDDQLYAVARKKVFEEGYGYRFHFSWKYCYLFDSAKDYLFLFERTALAPQATPIEWVKLYNLKFRNVGLSALRPMVCEDWIEFFSAELSSSNQAEIPMPSSADNPGRREQQHEIILAVIAALKFDPAQIPDGGKSEIKTACLTRARIFTDSSFDHAWKAGVSADLFRLANHEKYSAK